MFDKNHLMGNTHLKAEANMDFIQRIQQEQPDLAEAVNKLRDLLPEEVYKRAFSNIQTFNRRGDNLLIVSGGILQRTFLERDCIPALKEALNVKRVQIIG
mgnify:CR=1 FL=1